MREWRKVYKSLSTSQRAGQITDSAFALYAIALLHQDDAGRIPWNKPFARSITATRDWSWEQTQTLASEIVSAKLAWMEGGFLYIVKGKELNGKPHDAKKELLYPESTLDSDGVVATTGGVWSKPQESGGVEERREEETPPVVPPAGGPDRVSVDDGTDKASDSQPSRATEPVKKTSRRATPPVKLTVSDEFTAEMIARHQDKLGADGVADEIDRALAHEAAQKYKADPNAYVKGWLGREARQAQANGRASQNGYSPQDLKISDFPEPEPPREDNQAHSVWANDRAMWWDMNRPKEPRRR